MKRVNAFEILMQNTGDTHMKTPKKRVKRIYSRSSRKGLAVERVIQPRSFRCINRFSFWDTCHFNNLDGQRVDVSRGWNLGDRALWKTGFENEKEDGTVNFKLNVEWG